MFMSRSYEATWFQAIEGQKARSLTMDHSRANGAVSCINGEYLQPKMPAASGNFLNIDTKTGYFLGPLNEL